MAKRKEVRIELVHWKNTFGMESYREPQFLTDMYLNGNLVSNMYYTDIDDVNLMITPILKGLGFDVIIEERDDNGPD